MELDEHIIINNSEIALQAIMEAKNIPHKVIVNAKL